MIKKNKSWKYGIFAVICLILLIIIHGIWCNQALQLTTYQVKIENLPENFDRFRIAQISDLHNSELNDDHQKLITLLKQSDPDIIVITGDMIDSRNTDLKIALNFASKAIEIAPCYYVTGNHESRISEYEQFEEQLINIGVDVLRNESHSIRIHEDEILLLGVDDPAFMPHLTNEDAMITALSNFTYDDTTTILLSHRPELFDVYTQYGIDLTLSGHVHGGQIRLPFIGGLYGPHQGLLPQYDGGYYIQKDSHLIVSKGIGNSLFPLRINNRPEIVLVELVY